MVDKDYRKELIKGTIEEFRGPRFGHDEIISYDPWDEYLIGTVIPKSWTRKKRSPNNETMDDSDYTFSDDSSNDINASTFDNSSILDPSTQIKSFGISFIVNSLSPKIDICVTWARYFKDKDSELAFSLNGDTINKKDKITFWKRHSFGKIFSLIIDEKYSEGKYVEIDSIDKGLKLFIEHRNYNNNSHISIYFVNDLKLTPSSNKFRPETEDCIFQPSIRVNFKNDSIKMNTQIKSSNELDFLYRNKPVYAHGHLCSVIWKNIDYFDEFSSYNNLLWPEYSLCQFNNDFEKFKKPNIRSEFVPLYPINLPYFDININNLELSPEKLSNYSQSQLYANFNLLVNKYEMWIDETKSNDDLLKDISEEEKELIFNENGLVDKQIKTLDRIKKGISLLKSKKLVYLAFCFANKTISQQDIWKKKLNDDDKIFEWRPFQIAFILLNIESIWNNESIDKNILDLLWIPTGGGKTEAYLGIMAFTIALRRLKAYFGCSNEKTGAGVSVISRYTLRLLTVQQFRRTLRMITAAEFLRVYKCSNGSIGWRPKNCELTDDWIYGSVRFSVGMWVGGSVTPLHLNYKRRGAMAILKGYSDNDATGNPAQIIKCPVCGSWLYVPEDGLTDKKNNVHIVIKTELVKNQIKEKLVDFEKLDYVKSPIDVTSENHKKGFYTLSFEFNEYVSQKKYLQFINILKSYFTIASLNNLSIGYFKSRGRLGNKDVNDTDYEIWCTNPTCDLNHFWREGCPSIDEEKYKFPDGNYERYIISPYVNSSKIPIPAYLVDEHIYHRCPTVIVSTADKIARLSFEPRASAIFGNINLYNKYYGYCRNNLFPNDFSEISVKKEFNTQVQSFLAPDLIIQDELHLMNGPLGSLFGLYEIMVNALIKKQEGNPKYIASTATINNANHQVKSLFAKKVSQFPPYGLDISNSFWVHDSTEDIWDLSDEGRIYLGIYAPGMGAFTHQVRIYSRLLKIAQDNKKDKKHINPYWTVVGYYNTIRELGSAVALYKDDLIARVKHISSSNNVREIKYDGDRIELSSRIDSTKLPIILDDLERDGSNDLPKYNAIFTTSMFGTGVDISHLSAMVMNAQPKTTGDYIQATGRIGRNNGGLVIDLYRSGRPRDLNHYEMFPSYHSRIYREVEPISVSPFSEGCLSKGLGPSLVAFLRNAKNLNKNWTDKSDAKIISEPGADKDILYYKNFLKSYLGKMNMSKENIENIMNIFDMEVDKWKDSAEFLDSLHFYEYVYNKGKPHYDVVLGDPIHECLDDFETVYKNAPQSLREVEDTLKFWV